MNDNTSRTDQPITFTPEQLARARHRMQEKTQKDWTKPRRLVPGLFIMFAVTFAIAFAVALAVKVAGWIL